MDLVFTEVSGTDPNFITHTVTVESIDDGFDITSYTKTIFHTSVSSDPNYDGISVDLNVTVNQVVPPECGDWGFLTFDVSGPLGQPDCYVNLYDFAAFIEEWLECTDPLDPANCASVL